MIERNGISGLPPNQNQVNAGILVVATATTAEAVAATGSLVHALFYFYNLHCFKY